MNTSSISCQILYNDSNPIIRFLNYFLTIIGSEVSLLSCELPDGKPVVEVGIVLCRPLVGVVAVPRVIIPILGLEISSKPTPTVVFIVSLVILKYERFSYHS